jgi:hypothetical protein
MRFADKLFLKFHPLLADLARRPKDGRDIQP